VAVEVAEPEQPGLPAEQSSEAFAVDTADGPEAAAICPGSPTSGLEEARESVAAAHPPALTWQAPLPEDVLAWPLPMALSAPVAPLCTAPEHVAEPATQLIDPDASDTLSNPPATTGAGAADPPEPAPPTWPAVPEAAGEAARVAAGVAAVWRVGEVNRVADSEEVWQLVAVAVQSEDPVEVLAAAGAAAPVLGSTVTSPAPVEEVFDEPLPAQPVAPARQVTDTDAPLEPEPPALVVVLAPNRPAQPAPPVLVVGWLAVEPDAAWHPPVATVHEACPEVARVTGVTGGGAAEAEAVVPVAGVEGLAGTVSVWELFAPVLLVALPPHPVAPAAHWASANACGPPNPAPLNAWSAPPTPPPTLPVPPVWRLLVRMPVGSLTE
jgi:hypothetical protein